ncbi:MAG: type II toxin-antitoxin system VapC family toxin [Desulfobacteraceae bacterium]|nr:type II toxin-antitoxin system VapC family toxin [Desulfobacteraceae bacterium]MBU4001214.1 type II toxin-antitoxin system VapC family toxin [Pseudomonadota bacterium]MBU4055101.1 type II toxin-antitoxin system VapC family toxin [Pseudomonadota bacterium]
MNGDIDYLVDTNMIIYYLNGDPTAIDWLREHKARLSISIIVSLEVLSYPFAEPEDKIVRDFLDGFRLFVFDQPIFEKTIHLRRTHNIKLPDAIIASTAHCHNLTLVTRNVSDFNGLSIQVFNPFQSIS